MKIFCRIIIILLSLSLIACTTLMARRIQQAETTADQDYPPCNTIYPDLTKTVNVNLDRYKPVETRHSQHADVAFAIAASGGGYRAANLTLGVLLGLEKIHSSYFNNNVLQEINYFSTVSGGGLAVGFYLTKLHNYLLLHQNATAFSLRNEVNKLLASDMVTPNPLRVDLMQYVLVTREKGLMIEQMLNDKLLYTPQGGLTEQDIFVPANSNKPVQLPYWVINSTIYQNVANFSFTPDVLARYRVRSYYHNNRDYYLTGSYSNPTYAYQMPISVGLMASMTVPFVLPATTLTCNVHNKPCYLQLLDGGIADNLGFNPAINLLQQDKAKVKILIIVDSGKDLRQPFSNSKNPPTGLPLVVHSLGMSADGYRKYIKSDLNHLSHELLCGPGVDNVIPIYLDLEKFPNTQNISAQLKMSAEDQRLLVTIGEKIALENKTLRETLAQLSKGKLTLGTCHM